MAKAMSRRSGSILGVLFGARGFSGTLCTRVGPPAALSGPTVLPRTKGAPSLAATPWRPWCRRCWSRWRTSGAGSGRRRPAAGAPAAAAVGRLGHRRLLLLAPYHSDGSPEQELSRNNPTSLLKVIELAEVTIAEAGLTLSAGRDEEGKLEPLAQTTANHEEDVAVLRELIEGLDAPFRIGWRGVTLRRALCTTTSS